MSNVRWLVVGTGDIANKRVLPALDAEPRSEVAAVCDTEQARAEAAAAPRRARVFADYEAALGMEEVDAVYLCTPIALHVPHAVRALAAGKHVLVEKPVALNHAQAQELVAASRGSGRRCGVAYFRRFAPKYALAEEMLIEHKTRYGHSSTFVELNDGRILHNAGSAFTVSEDGGMSWSEVFRCTDTDGNSVAPMTESSLVILSGNGVGLAGRMYDKNAKNYGEGMRSNHFLFWRSDDAGKTWQPPIRVTEPGIIGTAGYQNSFLRASSGRILLPVFFFMGQYSGPCDQVLPANGKLVRNQWLPAGDHSYDPSFSCVYVLYSDDDGRTWKRNNNGELMIPLEPASNFHGVNESTMTEVAPGKLLVFMRSGLGRIFQSWSHDNGESWGRPQPTALASSNAPASINTLPNGHLLCVWSQENEEEVNLGFNRTRLSSAISRNGGGVWEFFQNVESMHEAIRVEPGPIHHIAPKEIHYEPGHPAPVRESKHIQESDVYGRWSYPSVRVLKDRVLKRINPVPSNTTPAKTKLRGPNRSASHPSKGPSIPFTILLNEKPVLNKVRLQPNSA